MKDDFLWLEDIDGERAMNWVNEQNTKTLATLKEHPKFSQIYDTCLRIFNSKERIAYPRLRGENIYNFWQDENHPRGIWRRTLRANYFKESPTWETLLDIAELSEKEGINWSFKGVDVLYPDFDIGMLKLSRGGGDAVVHREFNMDTQSFVEGGFELEEAKGGTSWLDRNTLLVSTDFGEGTMTSSGYARIVKKWTRGTPLSEAETLFEGRVDDVGISSFVQHTPERKYAFIARSISFFESEYYALENGKTTKLNLPLDAEINGFFKGQMLVSLRTDMEINGENLRGGSLIALEYEPLLNGCFKANVLFEPTERDSLGSVSTTKNQVLVRVFKGGRYDELYTHSFENGKWMNQLVATPKNGTLSVVTADDDSERYFFTHESMLTPRSLYFVPDQDSSIVKAKSMPEFFNADDYQVEFHEAFSKDGTRIPYSMVLSKDAKLDGTSPALLYGYGGFEVSLRPSYSPIAGSVWLPEGGVYVIANIRGGGEFGPKWHRAALKENRQRAFDDFIAVSEALIERGVCSSKTLGITGGSNGGLLVGVVATQRPDLYSAVVCSVPLLDMKRFNKLLAGASWMGEYGNPDLPEEWKYISKYSPYHNLKSKADYPQIFFTTTTRDDRVHPGHARKMAAKMALMGYQNFYFENTEGGHGAGVTNEQKALMASLEYAYRLKMLKP